VKGSGRIRNPGCASCAVSKWKTAGCARTADIPIAVRIDDMIWHRVLIFILKVLWFLIVLWLGR